MFSLGQLASKLLGFSCLCPKAVGLQAHIAMLGFHVDAGDLNSEPLAFTVVSLTNLVFLMR